MKRKSWAEARRRAAPAPPALKRTRGAASRAAGGEAERRQPPPAALETCLRIAGEGGVPGGGGARAGWPRGGREEARVGAGLPAAGRDGAGWGGGGGGIPSPVPVPVSRVPSRRWAPRRPAGGRCGRGAGKLPLSAGSRRDPGALGGRRRRRRRPLPSARAGGQPLPRRRLAERSTL